MINSLSRIFTAELIDRANLVAQAALLDVDTQRTTDHLDHLTKERGLPWRVAHAETRRWMIARAMEARR